MKYRVIAKPIYGNRKPRFYPVDWLPHPFLPNILVDKFPSVTTITSVLGKPALRGWAANMAVDYIISGPKVTEKLILEGDTEGVGRTTEHTIHDWDFNDARTAYLRASGEAADYGTYIHTLCEHYFKTNAEIKSPHEPTQKLMDSFYGWCKKRNVIPISTEQVVYGNGYAGRVDLICEIDTFWKTKAWRRNNGVEWYSGIGKERWPVLIDFKTGKGTYYPEWYLQTAGYRAKSPVIHHGVLKFNKDTLRVNYKDFSPEYEKNYRSFQNLVAFYWNECIILKEV